MNDLFEELLPDDSSLEIKQRSDLRRIYFQFLADFKNYLVEFMKESAIDLTISDLVVTPIPQKLFFGENGGLNVTLKNQGQVECFITTDRKGAYRLDPNEKLQFWLNKETTVVTLSGTTTIGFIRN